MQEQTRRTAVFETQTTLWRTRLIKFAAQYVEGTTLCPEDVVQEAYLNAYRSYLRHPERDYDWYRWLSVIVRNTACTMYRRMSPILKTALAIDDVPEEPIVWETETLLEWVSAMNTVLDKCDPVIQQIWELYLEGYTSKEISSRVSQYSPASIRCTIWRLRKRMSTRLTQLGLGPAATSLSGAVADVTERTDAHRGTDPQLHECRGLSDASEVPHSGERRRIVA